MCFHGLDCSRSFVFMVFPPACRRGRCVNMSKIAQAEYKAKACFQALLRRRRFSSAAQRSLLQGKCKVSVEPSSLGLCRTAAFTRCCNLFATAKLGIKKKVHETTPCTSVGFSVGSVGFPVGFTRSAASERHFRRLPPVAAHDPSHRSPSTCR